MGAEEIQDTDKQYLERWANTYTLCKSIPNDNRFEIQLWICQNDTPCGTSACIAGHAALHPWFRRLGLTTDRHGNFDPDERLGEVYGCVDTMATPFSPEIAATMIGIDVDIDGAPVDRITPNRAARAVRKYMLHYWSRDEVDSAIEAATVTYDANYVHKYTPWNND